MNAMTWKTVGEVLKHIEQTLKHGPDTGICHHFDWAAKHVFKLEVHFDHTYAVLDKMFSELGVDVTYPVEHPFLPPAAAFYTSHPGGHWSRSHQYGKNRWALLGKLRILAESKPQGEFA